MKITENISPTCSCRIERFNDAGSSNPKIKDAAMPVLLNPKQSAESSTPMLTEKEKEREEFHRKMATSHEWREQIFARPFTLQPLNAPTFDNKTEKPRNIEPTDSKTQSSLSDLKWTLIGGITGSVIATTIAKIVAVSSIINLTVSILSGLLIGILSGNYFDKSTQITKKMEMNAL